MSLITELNLIYVTNEKGNIILLENKIKKFSRKFSYYLDTSWASNIEEIMVNLFKALELNKKIIFTISKEKNVIFENSDTPYQLLEKASEIVSLKEGNFDSDEVSFFLVRVLDEIFKLKIEKDPVFRKAIVINHADASFIKSNTALERLVTSVFSTELQYLEDKYSGIIEHNSTLWFMALKEGFLPEKIDIPYIRKLIIENKELFTNASVMSRKELKFLPALIFLDSVEKLEKDELYSLAENILRIESLTLLADIPLALVKKKTKKYLKSLLEILGEFSVKKAKKNLVPINLILELIKVGEENFVKNIFTKYSEITIETSYSSYPTHFSFNFRGIFSMITAYLENVNWVYDYKDSFLKLFDILLSLRGDSKTILLILNLLNNLEYKNSSFEDRNIGEQFLHLSKEKIINIYRMQYSLDFLKKNYTLIKSLKSNFRNNFTRDAILQRFDFLGYKDRKYLTDSTFLSNGSILLMLILAVFEKPDYVPSVQSEKVEQGLKKEIIETGIRIISSDIPASERKRIIRILSSNIHCNLQLTPGIENTIKLFLETLSNSTIRTASLRKIFDFPEIPADSGYTEKKIKKEIFFGMDYTEFAQILLKSNTRSIINSTVLQLAIS